MSSSVQVKVNLLIERLCDQALDQVKDGGAPLPETIDAITRLLEAQHGPSESQDLVVLGFQQPANTDPGGGEEE